jgi:hypothetical protein
VPDVLAGDPEGAVQPVAMKTIRTTAAARDIT